MYKDNQFLTPNQAADVLNISLSTLKKLIYQGKMKTFKTPGGHHRILKSDLLSEYKILSSPSKKNSSGENVLLESIYAFTQMIESRHKFCRGHASFVAEISGHIARELELSEAKEAKITKAAYLHDIGMLTLSENLLNKNEPFDHKEYEMAKKHPLAGAQMLEEFEIFEDILPIIQQHHERPDGSGYPYGLKSEKICIEAKIVGLAESFASMMAEDSYKNPLTFEEAVTQIKQSSGTQFDPVVVNAFLQRAEYFNIEKVGP